MTTVAFVCLSLNRWGVVFGLFVSGYLVFFFLNMYTISSLCGGAKNSNPNLKDQRRKFNWIDQKQC